MKKGSLFKLVFSLLLVAIVLFFGSFFSYDMSWYKSLKKPPLLPPSYVFSIVWPILYFTIAIAFWKVWNKKIKNKKLTYLFFFLQLFFNLTWTFLFFHLKNISLAFLDIFLLDIFIVCTILSFFKISVFAAIFLIPYLLWVLFATYLNFGLLILN